MSNKPDYLLWCDLETTGLNPEHDVVLEMALVMTNPELEELSRFHWLGKPDLSLSSIRSEVIEMHQKNGLWNDVITRGSPGEPSMKVGNWMDEVLPTRSNPRGSGVLTDVPTNSIYFAGSSVHFDKQFLDKNFFFHRRMIFSHRVVDVSVIRTLLKMWDREDLMWAQSLTHRAMDDVLDHIEELKHYRRVLGLDKEA